MAPGEAYGYIAIYLAIVVFGLGLGIYLVIDWLRESLRRAPARPRSRNNALKRRSEG